MALRRGGTREPPEDPFAVETIDPVVADRRNFYKVETWSRDGHDRLERMLWAGKSLDRARGIFTTEKDRRPAARLTIRQRTRVLARWPEE